MVLRRLTGLGLAAILAACTGFMSLQSISLAGGDVLVAAPSGYCFDGSASRPAQSFAVIVPCATLGTGGPVPFVLGVISVQAGEPGTGEMAEDEVRLRDFLISPAGAGLLSASGNAGDVTILSTHAFDDTVMVFFRDNGAPPMEGMQNEEWRGFKSVAGRIVTVAIRGASERPIAEGSGAGLLKATLAGITDTTIQPGATPPVSN